MLPFWLHVSRSEQQHQGQNYRLWPVCGIEGKDDVWEQLKDTYVLELPDLAYRDIQSEGEIKHTFIELSSHILLTEILFS